MSPQRVLIADPVHEVLLQRLEERGFQCDNRPSITREELLSILKDYEVLVIRTKTQIDREVLQAATNLKLIARAGAGMDNIDEQFAIEKGIGCCNAPEGNRNAVAEHAMALLLALINKVCVSFDEVRALQWNREKNRGLELAGKTVGIIGFGNTGANFAGKLQSFDVKILAYDKYKTGFGSATIQESKLEELYKADFISLHVPLTSETHSFYDRQFFSSFQKPIYLINTSRGEVLPLKDLLTLLKEGKIIGAGLDVLEYESFKHLSLEQEDLLRRIFATEQVIATPHVAGWTQESFLKISEVLAEKIYKFFQKANA